jgi:hypothetical protein
VAAELADVPLETVNDLAKFLAQCVNAVRRGALDVKKAHAISPLVRELRQTLQPDDSSEEIEELRRQLDELKVSHGNGNGQAAPGAEGDPQGDCPAAGDGGELAGPSGAEAGPGAGDGLGGDDAGPLAEGPALFDCLTTSAFM